MVCGAVWVAVVDVEPHWNMVICGAVWVTVVCVESPEHGGLQCCVGGRGVCGAVLRQHLTPYVLLQETQRPTRRRVVTVHDSTHEGRVNT